MERQLLSTAEFAERNGISRVQVYRLLSRGEISARKIGRRTAIPVEVERAWRDSLPAFQSGRKKD